MTRILYIFRGLVPPDPDPMRDRFTYLSEVAEGDVLLPVWWKSPDEASPHLRATFPRYVVGKFTYHQFLEYRYPKALQALARIAFFVRKGLALHRKQPFDVIVSYGSNSTGIGAVLLKWLTGAKLVVEIPGVPEDAFRNDGHSMTAPTKVKQLVANLLLNIVGKAADAFKLLYPKQLSSLPWLKHKQAFVFHDFVPVRQIPCGSNDDGSILTIGYPWYTKGIDVLIAAFRSIAPQFPGATLKLLGYYPDRSTLDVLAGDCRRIELLPARPNPEAMDILARCSVFVLASRTEAMGRVLLEAMAANKPIIASRVGGIPHYIQDNDNGLLFDSCNPTQLQERLATVLADPVLRSRLAERGRQCVMDNYDELSWARAFGKALNSLQEPRRC
jgi:glycosyltransferase involved in cell wall biosynthesis